MSLRAQRSNLAFIGIMCLMSLSAASGSEFRSVAVNGAILYDAPSFKANRLYLISKQYPVEIVSRSGEWIKVRDANGDLSWIAANMLTDKRTLMVIANAADVRDAPNESAAIVFRAEKNVVLELVEPPTSTWIKVRHRDGQTGYARLNQIWGL